jgi:citrate lyase subunit beta/citryl-CoA lyase
MSAAPSRVGVCGRAGPDVRSDLRVECELVDSGGFHIELSSKVALCYGEQILAQSKAVLQRLGVTHARLTIEDRGALPFTVGARVEAAARRAGAAAPELAAADKARPSSARDRLRRSRLYLPGNEPKFMVNAGLHGPDGIILDLEDSVHAAEKDAGRVLVRHALQLLDFGEAERMVRINQLPLGLEDLDELVLVEPDLVLLPKVETAEQVQQVAERIGELSSRDIWLMPIIESALGVENAFAIASASSTVVALTVGLEDYTADLGVPKTKAGYESAWARSRIVNAAKAVGCQAIDSVYGDVGDREGLQKWAERARAMGFEGMGCIHPRQIPIIHQAFAPSQAELARALRIVAAYQEAQAAGLSVVSLGSKMIDPPVVNRALVLVARARQMGLTEKDALPSLKTGAP